MVVGMAALPAWVAIRTRRKWREAERESQRLGEAEARFRSLVERVPALTYIWDLRPDPGVAPHIYSSPQSIQILGFEPEAWESDPDLWLRQVHPDDQTIALAATERCEETGEPFSLDYRMFAKDGRVVWVHDEAVVTERDASGRPKIMQGVMIDITRRKELEEQLRQRTEELEWLSMTDSLTGLLNPRGFELLGNHELKVAERADRSLSLLFLDLDGLKGINDTFGHAAGDRALKDLADILRQTFRGSDVLARLGGDEFCVLLTGGEPPSTEEPATVRLIEAITQHREDTHRPYALSVSVGSAVIDPNDHASLRELVEEADRAMYEAKQTRRGAGA
jgi:diguanylate cyclase (GGDEF)-like protein/PAS domain S-box-containing protein